MAAPSAVGTGIIAELRSEHPYGHSTGLRTTFTCGLRVAGEEDLPPTGGTFKLVYVVSMNNKPLMPCENAVARLLLKDGKAKVKRREPFTIKLLQVSTEYTQPLRCACDTGSGTAGFAACNQQNEIVYASEVVVRNDIVKKMAQRRTYRRNRRNRKTRYRMPRFDNRHNSTKSGRFSPTMVSKIHTHEKEFNYISSILPITEIVLETGKFDPHLMKDPSLHSEKKKHWGYQRGSNYGFENTRMMVLNRDGYQCQCCKGKSKDPRLEVHHIVFRSKGGSDDAKNLVTLCHTCHKKLHAGKIHPDLSGASKGNLKHATQMNSIRKQLLAEYPSAIETFGYITAANRKNLGLDKLSHWSDACVIATGGEMPIMRTNSFYKKVCVPDGDFQQTWGIRSEKRYQTGKVHGFRKFDKVKYMGRYYFVKGKMSTGYAILMDIDQKKADFSTAPKGFKTPKFANMKRVQARDSWIITTEEATLSTL